MPNRKWLFKSIFIIGQLFFLTVNAQESTALITDRPDFTESAVVVPKGNLQLESGVTWERTSGINVLSGPELLLRWTFVDHLELRAGIPNYVNADEVSGFSDGSVGLKYQIGPWAQWDVGIIGTIALPTGEEDLTNDGIDPQLIFTVGTDLNSRWSLGIQGSTTWLTQPEVLQWGATIVTGTGLGQHVGTFFELAASAVESNPISYLLHHGYTFQPQPNSQLDIHAAIGLSDIAPDFLLGAGWSVRF